MIYKMYILWNAQTIDAKAWKSAHAACDTVETLNIFKPDIVQYSLHNFAL